MEIQFLLSKGLGTIPKMRTERFGSQPERSVFPVWGLTGFACYDISRAKNSILAPTKQTGARSLKFGIAGDGVQEVIELMGDAAICQ